MLELASVARNAVRHDDEAGLDGHGVAIVEHDPDIRRPPGVSRHVARRRRGPSRRPLTCFGAGAPRCRDTPRRLPGRVAESAFASPWVGRSGQPPKRTSVPPRSPVGLGVCGAIGAKGRPAASDLGWMPTRERGVEFLPGPMEPERCVGCVDVQGCRWSRLVVPTSRQTDQIMLILSVVRKMPAPSRRERQ
jgi:hypothetical protein